MQSLKEIVINVPEQSAVTLGEASRMTWLLLRPLRFGFWGLRNGTVDRELPLLTSNLGLIPTTL